MKVERIELRIVEMELVSPFETSMSRQTKRRSIIVTAEGGGEEGFGECVSGDGPYYSYETIGTAWHLLSDYLIPQVLGRELESPEGIVEGFRRIRGHNMAKASLEEAFLDLASKLEGVSLSIFLGGTRRSVESGVSIGIQPNVELLTKAIDEYLREGYRRIKIKIRPGWDLNVVKKVREAYPDVPLMVDANSAYTLEDTGIFKEMDRYSLMTVEQPLGYDDIVDHSALQKEIQTPICLDESIRDLGDVRKALDLGSCRIINIKAGRVGGLTISKKIHDYCMDRSVPVWCGGMLETGIGRAHNVALASLPNFKLPGDISASRRYYLEDIVEPPFEISSDGTIPVPQGKGIGVEVSLNRLDKITIEKKVFQA